MSYSIFTINPGSTSTKVALFRGDEKIFSRNIAHSAEELAQFPTISAQLPYRMNMITEALEAEKITLSKMDAFVGRGGGFYSMEGGVYELNQLMLDHATESPLGIQHPACLGVQIAYRMQKEYGGRVFVVNPPVVDEYGELARVTGIKEIPRESHLHALNLKEVGIRHAAVLGKPYEECNFVICHIGGGTSISAHRQGRMVDGNDIIGGEGPMTPTRCGSVPAEPLIELCFSGKYTKKELIERCRKNGGFLDWMGTADAVEVSERAAQGDETAKLVWDAMIYQIKKYIGSMVMALDGKVDGILLTGGMSRNQYLTEELTKACSFLAPVTVYAGEFEMEAMASGAVRVLEGKEAPKSYTGIPVWNGWNAGIHGRQEKYADGQKL